MKIAEKRIKNANELLAWLIKNGKLKGDYSYYVIDPFWKGTGRDYMESYEAWEILRENERLVHEQRDGKPYWEVINQTPILEV